MLLARRVSVRAGIAALLVHLHGLAFTTLDMNMMFAAGFIGGWEIILILAVVVLLFGAKKLPELAKGLGQGIKEFKKSASAPDEPEKPTSGKV